MVQSGNAEPLTPEEKSPPVKAGVVLRYMCADQQIDHLLQSYPLTVMLPNPLSSVFLNHEMRHLPSLFLHDVLALLKLS